MATLSGLPGISVELGLDGTKVTQGLRAADRQFTQFAQQATRSTQAASRGFNVAGGAIRGMATDLGVAVRQIGAGQNAIQALSIQLAQSTARFGAYGAIIGAGIAVLGSFAAGGRDAKDATDSLDRSQKLLDDTIAGSLPTLDAAIERYREMSAELRAFEQLNLGAVLRQQESDFEALVSQSEELADGYRRMTELAETFGQTNMFMDTTVTELDASIAALARGFLAGEIALGDFSAAVAIARTEAGDLASDELIELDKSLRKNVSEAVKLGEAMETTRRNMGLLEGDAAKLTKTTKELSEETRKAAQAAAQQDRFQQRRVDEQLRALSKIAEDTIKSGEAFGRSQRDAAQAIQDRIALQKILIANGGKETAEFVKQTELLRLKNAFGEDFARSQEANLDILARQSQELKKFGESADEIDRAMSTAADDIEDRDGQFVASMQEIFE